MPFEFRYVVKTIFSGIISIVLCLEMCFERVCLPTHDDEARCSFLSVNWAQSSIFNCELCVVDERSVLPFAISKEGVCSEWCFSVFKAGFLFSRELCWNAELFVMMGYRRLCETAVAKSSFMGKKSGPDKRSLRRVLKSAVASFLREQSPSSFWDAYVRHG